MFVPSLSLNRFTRLAATLAAISAGFWLLAPDAWLADGMLGAAVLVLAFAAPPWALVLLALAAPGEHTAVLAGGVTLYSPEMLLVACVPGFFWNFCRRAECRQAVVPVSIWILPLVLVLLLSAVSAYSPAAWKGVLRWLEFLLAMLMGVQAVGNRPEAELVAWALVMAAVMSALQGISQTAGGSALHPEIAAIAWGNGEVTRAAAGYGANGLAIILALVLPFTLAAAVFYPQGWGRLAGALGSGILVCGVLATFSFTGFLAIAGAAGTLLATAAYGRPRRIVCWLSLGILIAAAALRLQPEWFRGLFWESKLSSLADRLDYLFVVGRLLRTSPWIGIGPSLYRWLAPAWGAGVNPIGVITHPHSLYLTVLAELGVAGLAALAWAMVRAGEFLLRSARQSSGPGWDAAFRWALLAGLCGFAAANLVEHALIHDRGVSAALLLGVALALGRMKPDVSLFVKEGERGGVQQVHE